MYDGNTLPWLRGCPPSTEILGIHQYYGCDLVLFRGPCSYLNVTCYSPPDSSLTCQSVLAALQTVEDRKDDSDHIYKYSLESVLNIPLSKKRKFGMESVSVDQYREKLVQYYIMTNPASWDRLAGELLCMNDNKALEKVKNNIIRTKRGTYLISVIMNRFS